MAFQSRKKIVIHSPLGRRIPETSLILISKFIIAVAQQGFLPAVGMTMIRRAAFHSRRKRRVRNSVHPGTAAMACIETCPTPSGGWVAFQSRKKIVIHSPLGRRIPETSLILISKLIIAVAQQGFLPAVGMTWMMLGGFPKPQKNCQS